MSKQTNKILVVEDDQFMQKILKIKLKKAEFTVDTASDGEEALKLITENKYKLILLDLILPKLDGFAVLEKLKEKPRANNAPIVIISNLGQDSDVERGLSLGAIDYIVKANISMNDLIEKVKSYATK